MPEAEQYENARVLVADDEPESLRVVEMALSMLGCQIVVARDGSQALEKLGEETVDLIVSDQFMPGMTGIELLKKSRELQPDPPLFILITGQGTIELAVEAMRAGAHHFIEKPFEIQHFVAGVKSALDRLQVSIENRQLRQAVESHYVFSEIIGTSKKLEAALELAKRAAEQNSSVLILGESGTGKDLLARAIHFHGKRRAKPFVPINCGAIPKNLMESEFFGHVKGAFTGAVQDRHGCFEAAHGGTLFLDEIAEMPLDLQVKLLRVLEDRKIRRIGENREITVDCRIMAATNRPLQELVQQKVFRQDLYYRLNVLEIIIPPLRERPDDIPLLVEHFLRKAREDGETDVKSISPQAMNMLQGHAFPGNVRELINVLQRALLLCEGSSVEARHLSVGMPSYQGAVESPEESETLNLKEAAEIAINRVEEALIPRALEEARGNRKKAAQMLGISRGALYNKLQKLEDKGVEL